MRIAAGSLLGVLIALGTQGCGDDSTTPTTTQSVTEAFTAQRSAAFRRFRDILNKPGLTETEAHNGKFDTSEGTCQYNESSAGNGWVIECKSDSGPGISRFRFTPSATESQPDSSDYINRGNAIHGFNDLLSDPGFTRIQSGSFVVPNKGTCKYHRFANEMGWSVHCKAADSGHTSQYRFTP